ncbi:MAG TPA: hypothetical protein VHW24_20805, partial [Bryobacteraceae bacterium]|nr:hypothetical protein [Bryobacteraceae bacterium]
EHPEDHVLLLVEEDLADAGSRADEYHWHQYRVWKEIASSETVAGLRHVLRSLELRYFIARRPGPNDDLISPSTLAEYIANCTQPIIENGRFYAAKMTAECDALDDEALERKLAALPPALVSRGSYDDFDAALRFHGEWTRSRFFENPVNHTISYAYSKEARVSFAFEGNSLTYMFTRSANRGIASLEIDGVMHDIDLYAPQPQWQSRQEFCCLGAGRHLAILRATGRKQPHSSGEYIDLDAFIVK